MKLVTPASAMYSRELLRVSFQRLRVGARVLISAPYRRYRLNKVKNERSIATPNGIDSLESHILGHEKQWILVRGRDTNSPVMLFLQGGIDTPAFINVSLLGIKARLEESFVMVYWERRGIGKSYHRNFPKQTVNVEQTVADVHELSELLRRRFARERIYLAGHSWGAAMAMLAASRRPDLYHAVINSGQVVNTTEDVTMNYQFAVDEAVKTGNREAIKELNETGTPPYDYFRHLIYSKWAARFRGVSYSIAPKSLPKPGGPTAGDNTFDDNGNGSILARAGARLKGLLYAEPIVPEYSLKDAFNIAVRPDFSMKCIGEGFYDVNLFRQVPEIDVPVYFIQGRYERITPPEIVERYYNHLRAPKGKHLVWFETSAHAPYMKDPQQFNNVVVNTVLKETYRP